MIVSAATASPGEAAWPFRESKAGDGRAASHPRPCETPSDQTVLHTDGQGAGCELPTSHSDCREPSHVFRRGRKESVTVWASVSTGFVASPRGATLAGVSELRPTWTVRTPTGTPLTVEYDRLRSRWHVDPGGYERRPAPALADAAIDAVEPEPDERAGKRG